MNRGGSGVRCRASLAALALALLALGGWLGHAFVHLDEHAHGASTTCFLCHIGHAPLDDGDWRRAATTPPNERETGRVEVAHGGRPVAAPMWDAASPRAPPSA